MLRRRTYILAAVLTAMLGCGSGNWKSGDRVLVSKAAYETRITNPRRFDVVVFKWPRGPVEDNTPKNYIKRLLGLPGELLSIFFGQLFRWAPHPGEAPPFNDAQDPNVNPKALWERDFMHVNDKQSREWFEAGRFEIVRKTPDIMIALRRNVYDNDFPAKDMAGDPRWQPTLDSGWTADKHHGFSHDGKDGLAWLRYHHLVRPKDRPLGGPVALKPELITDFMSYNSFYQGQGFNRTPAANWVGDLMLEAEVKTTQGEGEVILELSKGIHRFQARFDVGSGVCTLLKNEYQEAAEGGSKWMKLVKSTELDQKPTRLRGPGTYNVRFANFDARLTVWVDRELPFGNGVDYPPPEVRRLPDEVEANLDNVALMHRRGPTRNDLEPASIASKGAAVTVRHLKLWRDTHYTLLAASADLDQGGRNVDLSGDFWSDPARWSPYWSMEFKTLYVQPGHYLCLGDNSQASSDSREWGVVPDRLMLGRALMVYYPFDRAGPIR